MEEQKATGGARRAEVGKRVTAPLTQLFPHHHHHQKNKNKNKKHHFLQIHSRETTPEEEDKMDPSAQSVAAAVHFIQRAVQRPSVIGKGMESHIWKPGVNRGSMPPTDTKHTNDGTRTTIRKGQVPAAMEIQKLHM